jgi:hypothetical protein
MLKENDKKSFGKWAWEKIAAHFEGVVMTAFMTSLGGFTYTFWEIIINLTTFKLIVFGFSIIIVLSIITVIIFYKKEDLFQVHQLQIFLSEWEKLGIDMPSQTARINLPSLMETKKEEIFNILSDQDKIYLISILTEEERGYLRNDIFAFAHCEPSYFDFWYKLRHLIENKIKDMS